MLFEGSPAMVSICISEGRKEVIQDSLPSIVWYLRYPSTEVLHFHRTFADVSVVWGTITHSKLGFSALSPSSKTLEQLRKVKNRMRIETSFKILNLPTIPNQLCKVFDFVPRYIDSSLLFAGRDLYLQEVRCQLPSQMPLLAQCDCLPIQ